MHCYPVTELTHYCNVALSRCPKIVEKQIDYYDFTFVFEGEMVYIIDGQKITLRKNDAIFLKPGTVRGREASTAPVAYASFNFLTAPETAFPFESYMSDCITDNIRKLVHLFPGTHRAGYSYAQQKCTNMLNYILFELLDHAALHTNDVHISKIVDYIETRIGEKISLTEISAHIRLSREHTSALFKKKTGKTIMEYINERKLCIAREYILSNELSLSEIAGLVGFDNYNYFSRLFKSKYNITPIALKKKCQTR